MVKYGGRRMTLGEYIENNSFSELVLDDSILSDDYINNNHIEF